MGNINGREDGRRKKKKALFGDLGKLGFRNFFYTSLMCELI